MTECRVPLTLRALQRVSGSAENMARLAEAIFLDCVPNWEAFIRQGALETSAKLTSCAMIGMLGG